jgi:hypothetical protein
VVAPDVNRDSSRPRPTLPAAIGRASLAIWSVTAAGDLLGAIAPDLAGATRPQATLHPSVSVVVGIASTNARTVVAPFLLVALGWQKHRVSRRLGDGLIVAIALLNGVSVGLEIGRWQLTLLPYIPQLPIEWTALAVSTAVWLHARTHSPAPVSTIRLAALALALTIAAASVEVLATPHAPEHVSPPKGNAIRVSSPRGDQVDCLHPDFCTACGHVASRSRAPFPSLSLGSARPPVGAYRATSTTQSPQGGIT